MKNHMEVKCKRITILITAWLALASECTVHATADNNPGTKALHQPSAGRARPSNATAAASPLNNFETGTRVTCCGLCDHKRDFYAGAGDNTWESSYYGSINQFDAVQDCLPLEVFVNCKFNPYWVWSSHTSNSVLTPLHKSMAILTVAADLIGPIASLFVRYPNTTFLASCAGVGVACFLANFDEDPRRNNPGYEIQTMDLDNTWGWVAYGGCNFKISGS